MISLASAEKVAEAVMCEGQVLYPYRASAAKNQLRWQFGVLAPRAFAEADSSDRWSMRATCLLDRAGPATAVLVRCRFGRTRSRSISVDGAAVPSVDVDGELYTSFDETVEDGADLGPLDLADLLAGSRSVPVERPEVLRFEEPAPGVVVTHRAAYLSAVLVVSATRIPGPYGLVRVDVTAENTTGWTPPAGAQRSGARRQDALRSAMISTHLLLGASDGRWLSAIDPPEFARGLVDPAANDGCYPVLVGDDRVVLAAPIILYDHPEIAPESPGDFCDATEIDEILALRTLTLTDEEKREARATDGRAAAIIDRCDNLPPEVWERLHGAVRAMEAPRPSPGAAPSPATEAASAPEPGEDTVEVTGGRAARGAKVRLHPSRAADAQDLFLEGRAATVTGVFTDFDGEMHIAVVIDDDPGADMHEWYGRFRYFKPFEVEVVR